MAYLILPSTLRRQPSFLTGVANDSLTSGLVLAWTGAVNADQSVFRRVPYMYGSGIFQPSVGRIGYCGNAAGSLSFTIPGNNGAVTIYREFELLSTALYTTPKLSYGVPYGSSINNNFFVSSSNFVSDSGSVVLGAHRGLNTLNTVWSVYPGSGTGMTFQVNDSNDVTVGSGGAAVSGDVAVRLFANPNGPEFGLTGGVVCSLFLIWHRALSIGERQTIKANPWQLFEPLPSRLYFLSPTGGTTHAVTSEETGSAADTPTAVATFAATAAETGSAADTPAATFTTAATAAESASAVDAPTSTATTTGTAAESGTATDTPTAVATLVAAVDETVSAAESTDADVTSESTGVIAETASATDTPSAIATFPASAVETAPPTDTPSAIATLPGTIAESASATETTDGTIVPAGQSECAETASAADAPTCVVVYAGSIAEGTASAVDLAAVAVVWATAVMAETASAADTTAATSQAALDADAVETAAALDATDAIFAKAGPGGMRRYALRNPGGRRPAAAQPHRPKSN